MSADMQVCRAIERDSLMHDVTARRMLRRLEGQKHYLRVTFALPMSPCVEKRTPSFVTPIRTVSPMVDRSLQCHRDVRHEH